jgi:hypothetical protein
MDQCHPLRFERVFNQRVIFIKKPTCITCIVISLIFIVVRSNPTTMILANPVTLNIIVLVFGTVGNSTSSKVETLN